MMAEKKSKSANTQTLATRVYFTHKLIAIYDTCAMFKPLTPSSEEFKKEKENLEALLQKIRNAQTSDDDKAFEEGILAEEELQQKQVLNKDGNLKSDEELLAQINQIRENEKKQKLAEVLSFYKGDENQKAFQSFLKTQNISDLTAFVSKDQGNPKKLREKLAQDFELWQKIDPSNALVSILRQPIAEQTASLNAKYYYVEENPTRNKEVREDFNTNDNSKKKFLKLMGNLFALGEGLQKNDKLTDIAAYCKKIRELTSNPELSDEAIKATAQKAYTSLSEGLWFYKNKVNPDPHCDKESYIQVNVSQWIKNLKITGKNNLLTLALLSPQDEKIYKTATEQKREEIAKKHISIHHKIPEKYHAIFQNREDHFLLNHISNLEMVIGGTLHDQMHENDMQNMLKLTSSKNSAILCVPGDDFELNHAKETALDIPEPEKLAALRPEKTDQNNDEQKVLSYSNTNTRSR